MTPVQEYLSHPARAVTIPPDATVYQAIKVERARRVALVKSRKPYHHWRERGDDSAPREEHWCTHCTGFYGVPHSHKPNQLCRSFGKVTGSRQCACIDCVVGEAWSVTRP